MDTSVPFDTLVELLIYAFIGLALLCIGMATKLSEMGALLRDRTRLAKALFVNIIIAPLAALVLIGLIPMPAAAASVLLLLAFAPGGINAVQFTTKAPGQLATAAELLFVLSALSLVTLPLAAGVVLPDGAAIQVPVSELVFRLVALVVGPLLLGAILGSRAPALAERLYKPAMLASTLAFIASVIISMGVRQDALGELGTGTTIAFLLFVLIMMLAGWMFGGSQSESRQVLAVSSNLRNVGLVYVVVDGCCADPNLANAVLAFMAIMVLPNLVLTLGLAIWRKRTAA